MIKWNRREFMQASTASLLLNRLEVSALPGGPDKVDGKDSAFVRTNDEGKSWTLGNSLVEREIHFDPKLGLHTASWRHKVTGTEFTGAGGKWGPQGHEFSVLVDGDSFRGSNGSAWELIDAKTQKLTPSARSLIVNLRAKTKPVDVAIFYAVYDTHPIVQKWIAITNRGAAPVTLSHFIFESVGVAAGPVVRQNSGRLQNQ